MKFSALPSTSNKFNRHNRQVCATATQCTWQKIIVTESSNYLHWWFDEMQIVVDLRVVNVNLSLCCCLLLLYSAEKDEFILSEHKWIEYSLVWTVLIVLLEFYPCGTAILSQHFADVQDKYVQGILQFFQSSGSGQLTLKPLLHSHEGLQLTLSIYICCEALRLVSERCHAQSGIWIRARSTRWRSPWRRRWMGWSNGWRWPREWPVATIHVLVPIYLRTFFGPKTWKKKPLINAKVKKAYCCFMVKKDLFFFFAILWI